MADESTSVRGGKHCSNWVPNMLKDMARERLTATEVAIRYHVSIETARRWLAAFYEAGISDRRSRPGGHAVTGGRPEVENWVSSAWGGQQ